jgi:TPR repeat protein
VRLFKLAAEQGNANGQANLGLMYENGRGGVSKDLDTAVSWYSKAASQGQQYAINRLQVLGHQ